MKITYLWLLLTKTSGMRLSDKENQELEDLRKIQQCHDVMAETLLDKLEYLHNKQFHNCCSNPHCTGYEGKEVEIFCPKCKKPLMKTLNLCVNCEHCELDDNRVGKDVYLCGVTEEDISDIEQDGCDDNYVSV